jgi:uncharacterized membrane protein
MKRLGLFFLIFYSLFFTTLPPVAAQTQQDTTEEILRAEVTSIHQQEKYQRYGVPYIQQILKVRFLDGTKRGDTVQVATMPVPVAAFAGYKEEQKLLIGHLKGTESYYVIDTLREKPILFLTLVFVLLVLAVARMKGLRALLALVVSFVIIFQLLLPLLTRGLNPFLVVIIGACILIPTTFYLSHGVTRKITLAMGCTLATLFLTVFLAFFILKALAITGLGIDAFETLLLTSGLPFGVEALLLVGITIAAIGILDDITITQLSLIEGLSTVSQKLTRRTLFLKAMHVGQDHIASVVNTLILVYAGSSLPLLLLFAEYPRPFRVRLNSEIIVLEIVTALVTTIGIVLAVPLTTALGVYHRKYWLTKPSADNKTGK